MKKRNKFCPFSYLFYSYFHFKLIEKFKRCVLLPFCLCPTSILIYYLNDKYDTLFHLSFQHSDGSVLKSQIKNYFIQDLCGSQRTPAMWSHNKVNYYFCTRSKRSQRLILRYLVLTSLLAQWLRNQTAELIVAGSICEFSAWNKYFYGLVVPDLYVCVC